MLILCIIIAIVYCVLSGILYYFLEDSPMEEVRDFLKSLLTPIFAVAVIIVYILSMPMRFGEWISRKLDEKFDLKK